jgi:RNA polymerase sigma-70 factor, ECF subfamily
MHQYQTAPETDPDASLITAMATGNMQALDELYARHASGLLAFLQARLNNRQLAEEVLQDTMLAAWNNAANFRGDSSVKTWLLVIARNRAINTQRKQRPQLVDVDKVYDLASTDTGPYEAVAREFDRSAVRDALQDLKPEQREILVLFFFQQLTGPEIADVLNISVGTVKSRLHRAKEALRRTMTLREGNAGE